MTVRRPDRKNRLMESHLIFLDCPAYLDDDCRARCGLPAEVLRTVMAESTGGPLEIVMIKCPVGRHFNAPTEFLSLESNLVTSWRRS